MYARQCVRQCQHRHGVCGSPDICRVDMTVHSAGLRLVACQLVCTLRAGVPAGVEQTFCVLFCPAMSRLIAALAVIAPALCACGVPLNMVALARSDSQAVACSSTARQSVPLLLTAGGIPADVGSASSNHSATAGDATVGRVPCGLRDEVRQPCAAVDALAVWQCCSLQFRLVQFGLVYFSSVT